MRNTENMFSVSLRKHRDEAEGKQLVNFAGLSKCRFSLLAPSLGQQLVPVLCLHRVLYNKPSYSRILIGSHL